MDWATIVLVLTTLASVVTSLGLAFKARAEKKKINVDAAAVISSTSIALLGPMQQEIQRLEERLKEANKRADDLDRQLTATTATLKERTRQLNRAAERIEELERRQP